MIFDMGRNSGSPAVTLACPGFGSPGRNLVLWNCFASLLPKEKENVYRFLASPFPSNEALFIVGGVAGSCPEDYCSDCESISRRSDKLSSWRKATFLCPSRICLWHFHQGPWSCFWANLTALGSLESASDYLEAQNKCCFWSSSGSWGLVLLLSIGLICILGLICRRVVNGSYKDKVCIEAVMQISSGEWAKMW